MSGFVFSLQLKEQITLLEAQLEKQSDNQRLSEGMEQVHEQVKTKLYSNHTGTGTTATFGRCICMYSLFCQAGEINRISI